VISRLKGIAPGLAFDERNGQTKLSLRGRSTIFANDQPLVVVDGFPYEGNLNNLNPNDVESVTLLKDAAAASIWGVRAGNGVIVVTTKNAKGGQKLNIETNVNFSLGQKPGLFSQPQITSSDFIDAEQRWFNLGLYDADLANTTNFAPVSPVISLLDQQRKGLIDAATVNQTLANLKQQDLRNDLLNYFYAPAAVQQYSLALSGSTEQYRYRFTVGYDNNNQSLKGNSYQRIYLNGKQNIELAKGFNLNLQTQWILSRNNVQNALSNLNVGGPNARATYPYSRLAEENGNALTLIKDLTSTYKNMQEAKGYLDWSYRPLEELGLGKNTRNQNEVRLNGGLDYSIVPSLNATLTYQYENQQGKNENLQSENSYAVRNLINRYTVMSGTTLQRNIPLGGILDIGNSNLQRQSLRGQLNFDRQLGEHQLNMIAGAEAREITNRSFTNRYYGYDESLAAGTTVNYRTDYALSPEGFGLVPNNENIGRLVERYRSFYANAGYSYKQTYVLTASARIDQSNFFGVAANQRSVPLWSAGVKWNVDRESFYKLSNVLPKLSLRASYGYNGNLDREVTAYTTAGFSTSVTTGQQAATIYTPPNPNLQWERVGILNVGIDFATKNETVSGSIEYYQKNAKDLIGFSLLDPTVGLKSYRGNVAAMTTQGIDVTLNARPLRGNINWNLTALLSYTTDKVTSYNMKTGFAAYFADASLEGNVTDLYAPTIGKPLFGVYSRKWAGLNPSNGNPMGYLNGKQSEDYAQLLSPIGQTVDSLVYHGRALPPLFGSIANSFSFKNITLAFNISYKFGYYYRNSSISYSSLYSRGAGHSDYGKRWQSPGNEAFTHVPSFSETVNPNRDAFYATSAVLVERGDHIRLQDISLDYEVQLPNNLRKHIKRLNIYGYANQLGILWRKNKNRIDPDYPSQRPPKIYSLGMRFSL
jgi:TonB-linked SusC/RagA family outer membrane protein